MHIRKGEVSLLLLTVGVAASLFGLVMVANYASKQTSLNSSAASFPFKSILEIKDESGNVIQWEEGMRWSNGLPDSGKTEGNIRDPEETLARLTWDPGSVPENLQDVFANVVVSMPARYQVMDAFCESEPDFICSNTSLTSDKLTRKNIQIAKNGLVTYGLIVKDLTPPSGKGNMEVQVVALNYPKQTSFFSSSHIASQAPTACSRISSGQQRPLYLYSFTLKATCVSGSCQQGEVFESSANKRAGYTTFSQIPVGTYSISIDDIDKKGFSLWDGCKSEQFTVSGNKTNQEAVIILANNESGEYVQTPTEQICRDRNGQANIIQDVNNILCYISESAAERPRETPEEPPRTVTQPPQPPQEPPGSCGTVCAYSEVRNGQTQCFQGNCPVGATNCGLNTNCSYVSGCSTGTLIECPGHTPIPNNPNPPAPNPPPPNPPAPNPPPPAEEECRHLEGNGPYRIVIVPDDFTSRASFEEYARAAVADIRNSDLKDVYGKLSFVMSTNMTRDYNCRVNSNGLTCSGYETPKSECGASPGAVIVIWNNNFNDYAQSARGVAVLPLPRVSVSTAHELGHAIARLYDEYVYPDQANAPYSGQPESGRVNCAPTSDTACNKWNASSSSDVGCFTGCSLTSWRRPIERYSMMGLPENRVGAGAKWHRIHVDEWRRRVSAEVGFASANLDQSPYHLSTHIILKQTAIDNVTATLIQNENSYALTEDENGAENYYIITLEDKNNNILFTKKEDKEIELLHEGPRNQGLRDEIQLYLPYFDDAENLVVKNDDGEQVLEIPLKEYELSITDDTQNLCGNSFCDAAVGETKNSCQVDCGEHLVKSELERSDLNGDGVVSAFDLALMIEHDSTGDVNGDGIKNALDYSVIIRWLGFDVR